MYGTPQYKFPYGALRTPLNSSPLQGQSSGKKKKNQKQNLKGLENQQALPISALFLIFENRNRHWLCYEAGLIVRPMCLWNSMLFRIWYSKWVISVGINIGMLNQLNCIIVTKTVVNE